MTAIVSVNWTDHVTPGQPPAPARPGRGDRWVIVPENDPEYQVSRLPGAMSIRFPKALGAGFFRLRATLN